MGIGNKGNIKSNFHDSFGENLDLKRQICFIVI